ncbi:hypothetical protein Tco_0369645 [Tanacetum coccineum]
MSMDDLYNNLKVYESEIKDQTSSSSNSQNVAVVSSDNFSSTNEIVNTAHSVSTASSKDQASTASYADGVMFSFFANQFNAPTGNRNRDDPRRNAPVDTSTTNALVVQDGIGSSSSSSSDSETTVQRYDDQMNESELNNIHMNMSEVVHSVFNSRESNVDDNPVNDRFKIGSGPDWHFDIDLLTNSMNYEPVTAWNQTNGNAANVISQQNTVKEMVTKRKEELKIKKVTKVQDLRTELDNLLVQQKEGYANSTNRVSTVSPSVSADGQSFENVDDLLTDPLMPDLEDTTDLLNTGIISGAYDDDEGAEADLYNLETTINISHIPTTRIYKDHPKDQIIGDINSVTQTKRMTKISQEHAMKVWRLVDLSKGKHAIGTKWVYRNKKDERWIVVRNKARTVYAHDGISDEFGVKTGSCKVNAARQDLVLLGKIEGKGSGQPSEPQPPPSTTPPLLGIKLSALSTVMPKDLRLLVRELLLLVQDSAAGEKTNTAERSLQSVEDRLVHYKKNEAVFEESINVLKLEVRLRDNALDEYKMKLDKEEKERGMKITEIVQESGISLVQHDAEIQGRHEHEPEFDLDAANVLVTTAGAEISIASPEVKIADDSIEDITAET